jgi:GDP/UDP-N,N'-diacetylbacillosamine 2-epimerase (hydrolysing)
MPGALTSEKDCDMRRVLAVTGIRSEYFLARPIFSAIRAHQELELQLVVSGAHLSPTHDYSVRAIEADGFPILERIESMIYSDRDAARLKGAALQLSTLAHVIDRERPDWLLAIADREEPLLVAMCGAYMNIPVVHYSAGDRVVGNVDDMVRHAVSRLSHMLLTTSEASSERLIRSGEQPWRVHFVGHSGIDRLRTTPQLDPVQLAAGLEVPRIPERYAVLIQHAISTEIAESGAQMEQTLQALAQVGLPTFISYPNSDPGREEIIAAIERRRGSKDFFIFRNVADREFVNLLRGAAVLVGNSSAGLLEAPYLKLPVVNVGRRQSERTHADNVFFVDHRKDEIADLLREILESPTVAACVANIQNPFGDGYTGQRVAELLARTPIDPRLLNKDLTF